MKKRFAVCVGLLCLIQGCTDVGGKYSTVTIKTDSNDANTYLVPFDSWNKMSKEGKPVNAQTLSGYRKGQGGAVVKSVNAFRQVAVVEKNGKIEYREFTPDVPQCEIMVPTPR